MDNLMFTGVRVPYCDFVVCVRMRESHYTVGHGEEAIT